jgi:hypothetical protein
MRRALRWALALLLLPGPLWAAAAETITISSSATGPTAGLCAVGAGQTGAFIQILDQPVYYTLHSPTATPSSTVGGYATANTIIQVDRASEFRAIRAGGTDARAYILCVAR